MGTFQMHTPRVSTPHLEEAVSSLLLVICDGIHGPAMRPLLPSGLQDIVGRPKRRIQGFVVGQRRHAANRGDLVFVQIHPHQAHALGPHFAGFVLQA